MCGCKKRCKKEHKNCDNLNVNPQVNPNGYADIYFPVPQNCEDPVTVCCEPLESCCKKEIKYVTCCDPNGCCYKYPACCRNPFWPEFCKPRWLCCKDLYNNGGI